MQSKDLINRLRQFDAYPKTLEDFRVKTFGGATVTIISGILMAVLFVSELNYYLTKEVHPELFVDTTRGQKLKINVDITFPHVACPFLSIDAMDVSGEQQIDVDHNILKQRLNQLGIAISDAVEKEELGDKSGQFVDAIKKVELDPKRCESCYGAETVQLKCCNSCDDVREAYRIKGWAFNNPEAIEQCSREGWSQKLKNQQKEGCRVYGYLEVNKVAGNFHFAPGKSFQQHHVHVHDLQAFQGQKIPMSSIHSPTLALTLGFSLLSIIYQGLTEFNMTHDIKHLSFGTDYPGIVNPLDDTSQAADRKSMMFQYFVKIVPTTYSKLTGQILYTNQFSVTKHQKVVAEGLLGEQGLPGVFFMYELSPMMVKYTEKQRSFMHFLTGVCAIVGGIFTVAGLIDSMIYHSARAIQKKIELGKAS